MSCALLFSISCVIKIHVIVNIFHSVTVVHWNPRVKKYIPR